MEDGVLNAITGQHVIEHLDLGRELLPLLIELRRVADEGAELWLSCPDLQKVCEGYVADRGAGLMEDKKSRQEHSVGDAPVRDIFSGDVPVQHIINDLVPPGRADIATSSTSSS